MILGLPIVSPKWDGNFCFKGVFTIMPLLLIADTRHARQFPSWTYPHTPLPLCPLLKWLIKNGWITLLSDNWDHISGIVINVSHLLSHHFHTSWIPNQYKWRRGGNLLFLVSLTMWKYRERFIIAQPGLITIYTPIYFIPSRLCTGIKTLCSIYTTSTSIQFCRHFSQK